ncbi:hypothetical protein HS048_31055 [Planomonospora sp. ID91781]|uniref:Scr1 family TA system antitoxin-like transcriptional regulator n=1 Tax=Planomonospora sp. ID91781 TaxID=2738135 RepID=UPI0018C41B31|nr:Scr1 family TA system antitoxin-like transcriptional regulator [Planomonospora sp. ID91781]MBG0825134.1 hypothetical protein [Planomonospora sp. ID91781]
MQRKGIFDRENPPLVLVDAGVPRRKVGGAEVMREQLGHLLKAVQRPTVYIQIVDPERLTGLLSAFMIDELPNGQPDAVQVDSSATGQVTTEDETVNAIWKRYEAIRRWAYPDLISAKMIGEARREWI